MGQYKVPQNVEAEDKILGPLTFKEFIYFMIGFGWAALMFAIFRKAIPVFLVLGLPIAFFFFMLAFFHRDGQNFEQILIALLQFFAASRRRAWRKNDEIETFHVEPAAQRLENTQRDPRQVLSELEKLSRLIDSRGWNHPPEEGNGLGNALLMPAMANADRIVPTAPGVQTDNPTDMLDLQKSPAARNLAELLQAAAATPSISDVTPITSNDILKLATKSDELKVSQIAAQATRAALPSSPATEVPK